MLNRIEDNKLGELSIVATPIGNLQDITIRAIEVLKGVKLILAEDTRHSAGLLRFHGVSTPMMSLHEHNEQQQVNAVMQKLRDGQDLALISDAGTPLISDPGYRLVSAARENGFSVTPIPGPCAFIAALSAAGLPTDRILYEGFLPAKQEARDKKLEGTKSNKGTHVFYESSHRIIDSLKSIERVYGSERKITIARELTKRFETFYQGAVSDVLNTVNSDSMHQKGEFVVMVEGASSGDDALAEGQRILGIMLKAMPLKTAARLASDISGINKNELYQYGLKLKQID